MVFDGEAGYVPVGENVSGGRGKGRRAGGQEGGWGCSQLPPTRPGRVIRDASLLSSSSPPAMKQNGALQRPPLPIQYFNPNLKHSLSPFLPRQPHRNLLSTLQSILLSLHKSSSRRSFAMGSLRLCVSLMSPTSSISSMHAGCPSEDPNSTSLSCPMSVAHLHIPTAHRARIHPPPSRHWRN